MPKPTPTPRPLPKTSSAEERSSVEALIKGAKLSSAHSSRVKRALRCAIGLYTRRVPDDALPVGTSRFGGLPDLAPAARWPHAAQMPMTFLAQLKLEELAPFDLDGLLPTKGLLSFFLHDWFPDSGKAPRAYSACQVLFFADASGLRRAGVPAGFKLSRKRKPLATASLRFHSCFELPSPGTHEAESLEPMPELPRPKARSQVLGYDDYHGYDVAPPRGTRPLLRCESDPQAEMNFGDAQDISFRIADRDLTARRFDRTHLWYQAG